VVLFRVDTNIEDAQVPDLYSALRFKFGKKGDGTDFSDAEIQELVRSGFRNQLKEIFLDWQRKQPKDLNIT
jgi:hypothetical protein